jgi:hypothetical protein
MREEPPATDPGSPGQEGDSREGGEPLPARRPRVD